MKKSKIYLLFEESLEPRPANSRAISIHICRICDRRIGYYGSPRNLFNHIVTRHREEYEEFMNMTEDEILRRYGPESPDIEEGNNEDQHANPMPGPSNQRNGTLAQRESNNGNVPNNGNEVGEVANNEEDLYANPTPGSSNQRNGTLAQSESNNGNVPNNVNGVGEVANNEQDLYANPTPGSSNQRNGTIAQSESNNGNVPNNVNGVGERVNDEQDANSCRCRMQDAGDNPAPRPSNQRNGTFAQSESNNANVASNITEVGEVAHESIKVPGGDGEWVCHECVNDMKHFTKLKSSAAQEVAHENVKAPGGDGEWVCHECVSDIKKFKELTFSAVKEMVTKNIGSSQQHQYGMDWSTIDQGMPGPSNQQRRFQYGTVAQREPIPLNTIDHSAVQQLVNENSGPNQQHRHGMDWPTINQSMPGPSNQGRFQNGTAAQREPIPLNIIDHDTIQEMVTENNGPNHQHPYVIDWPTNGQPISGPGPSNQPQFQNGTFAQRDSDHLSMINCSGIQETVPENIGPNQYLIDWPTIDQAMPGPSNQLHFANGTAGQRESDQSSVVNCSAVHEMSSENNVLVFSREDLNVNINQASTPDIGNLNTYLVAETPQDWTHELSGEGRSDLKHF